MLRKDFIPLLLHNPKSVSQLARELGVKVKEVENDLQHLLQSLRNMDYEAVIAPARCRKCGFEFSRDKLSKPSRCPECKNTWLSEAEIEIREKM